jgi:hypothetical protein
MALIEQVVTDRASFGHKWNGVGLCGVRVTYLKTNVCLNDPRVGSGRVLSCAKLYSPPRRLPVPVISKYRLSARLSWHQLVRSCCCCSFRPCADIYLGPQLAVPDQTRKRISRPDHAHNITSRNKLTHVVMPMNQMLKQFFQCASNNCHALHLLAETDSEERNESKQNCWSRLIDTCVFIRIVLHEYSSVAF